MATKVPMSIEELKKFYLEAYRDGQMARLVCGGLSNIKLQDVSDTEVYKTLIKSYIKDR